MGSSLTASITPSSLLTNMSIIGQTVENAGVKLFADLYGGAPAPGTNVIVYNLNPGQGLVTGSRNQNV